MATQLMVPPLKCLPLLMSKEENSSSKVNSISDDNLIDATKIYKKKSFSYLLNKQGSMRSNLSDRSFVIGSTGVLLCLILKNYAVFIYINHGHVCDCFFRKNVRVTSINFYREQIEFFIILEAYQVENQTTWIIQRALAASYSLFNHFLIEFRCIYWWSFIRRHHPQSISSVWYTFDNEGGIFLWKNLSLSDLSLMIHAYSSFSFNSTNVFDLFFFYFCWQ